MKMGDRVTADVPMGNDETRPFPGTVDRVITAADGKGYRVQFDDPLIYGGTGRAWFDEDEIHAL